MTMRVPAMARSGRYEARIQTDEAIQRISQVLLRPGEDVIFLGEEDDLPLAAELMEQREDRERALPIGLRRHVVEDKRTHLACLCEVGGEGHTQEEICLLRRPVRQERGAAPSKGRSAHLHVERLRVDAHLIVAV